MKQIFVSSTFKDMHIERDLIQTKLSPDLNQKAYEKRVEGIQFQDLRWGIDANLEDEIENDKKIIEVCLDEIQNNRPYFCVLLGDRYGWIPDNDLVKKTGVQYGIYDEDEVADKSITHLEIDYGFLRNPEYRDQSFAYIRNIKGDVSGTIYESNPEEKQKLEDLKAEIRRTLPAENIREYDVVYENGRLIGVENFANMAAEDMTRAIIDPQVSDDALTENEKEILYHKTQRDEKSIISNARKHIEDAVLNDIKSENIVTIKGESGNGKSTLMSKISLNVEKENQALILFSALTPKTASADGIMKIITDYLEERIPQDETKEEEIREIDFDNFNENQEALAGAKRPNAARSKEEKAYEQTVREYFAKGEENIIFIIDAIDQLDDPKGIEALLKPINFENESKIKFIISFLEEENTKDDFIFLNDYKNYELHELSPDDRLHVINSSLKVNNKEMAREVKEQIAKKVGSKSPLYVSLLVQRLLMMNNEDYQNIRQAGDDYQSIINYQKKLVDSLPDDLEELIIELITQAAANLNTDSAEVYKTINYLSASRRGLRESDLKKIFEINGKTYNALDFATLKKYLRAFFLEDKYLRTDFTHKIIRKAVLKVITKEENIRLHNNIAKAFMSLPIEDPIKLGEQYYSAYKSHNLEAAHELLLNLGKNASTLSIDEINMAIQNITKIHNTKLKAVDNNWGKEVFDGLKAVDIETQKTLLAYFVYGSYEERTMEAIKATKYNQAILLDYLSRLSIEYPDDSEILRIYADLLSYLGVRFTSGSRKESTKAENHLLYSVKLNERIYEVEPNDSNKEELGNVYSHLARFYLERGEKFSDKSARYYQKSLDIFKEIAEDNPNLVNLENLAMAYNNIANLYVTSKGDDLRQARDYYKKTIHIITGLLEEHDSIGLKKTLAMGHINIASLDFSEDNFDSAEKWYLRAIDTIKEIEVIEPSLENKETLAKVYNNIADLFASELIDNKKKAETYYQKAIKTYKAILKHKPIVSAKLGLSVAYDNLATLYADWKIDRAFENYQKAIGIKDELITLNSSRNDIIDLATSYNNLAFLYVDNKTNYELAKQYYLRSLDLLGQIDLEGVEKKHGEDLAVVNTNLGALYYILDDIENSIIHYKKAIAIHKDLIKRFHDDDNIEKLLIIYDNLAVNKTDMEEFSLQDIETDYIKVINLIKEMKDPYKKLKKTAITYANLGNLYFLRDDNFKLAEDCFLKAVGLTKQVIDYHASVENIERLVVIYYNLAFLYKQWGKNNKAADYQHLIDELEKEIGYEENDENLNKFIYRHYIEIE